MELDRKALALAQVAQEAFEAHKSVYETAWSDGEIERVWQDDPDFFCIAYTSQKWWHYRKLGNHRFEWW